MRGRRISVTVVAFSALAAAPIVLGQVARSGGGAQPQALQQVQALAAERTALQAENARLKKELESLKASGAGGEKERASLKSQAAAARDAAARAAAAGQAADQSLQQSKGRLDELIGKFRGMAESLRNVESERTQLREQLAARSGAFDNCARQNLELYSITTDVLTRYEQAGLGHALARAEPFTQLTRTRIENLVDEYRTRARELKVAPTAANGPPPR